MRFSSEMRQQEHQQHITEGEDGRESQWWHNTSTARSPRLLPTSRAGTPRAGTTTAGTPRAGTPRAGTPRADTPRAGTPRAGTPRAGTPRAGMGELKDVPQIESLMVE